MGNTVKFDTGPDGVRVEELGFDPDQGLMRMRMQHPIFAQMVDQMCAFFADAGAVNYLEFDCTSDRFGKMQVLIQRADGRTPAQENIRLKDDNKALRAALENMCAVGAEYYDMDCGENGSAALAMAKEALGEKE